MDGPTLSSKDRIKVFTGVPEKGCWNYIGNHVSIDHGDIIGVMATPVDIPEGYSNLVDWYIDQCKLLWSLTID
jgi:triacylglycerol lipase